MLLWRDLPLGCGMNVTMATGPIADGSSRSFVVIPARAMHSTLAERKTRKVFKPLREVYFAGGRLGKLHRAILWIYGGKKEKRNRQSAK